MNSTKFVKSLLKAQSPHGKKVDVVFDDNFNVSEVNDTMDLLLDSVYDVYKNDTTKPGVLVSKIGKGSRKFYASILRFTGGAKTRTVVVCADGKTKNEAIEKLAKKWLSSQKFTPSPMDQLKNHLGV